ncbi:hypothetical protein [Xanthomonas vasicola]|uniref:hypothetical protein n=1 Tax=Xanthomonas vasicola TaxID=56459 RepID=UPI0018AF8660|nr:hypothetical protein [Xanthomonas vasicola]
MLIDFSRSTSCWVSVDPAATQEHNQVFYDALRIHGKGLADLMWPSKSTGSTYRHMLF